MTNLLFVYGTLRKDATFSRARQFFDGKAEFVTYGHVKGSLYDLGSFPGFRQEGKSLVKGELWHISRPDKLLPTLDSYEGYRHDSESNSLYIRRVVPVMKDDMSAGRAWVYIYNAEIHKSRLVNTGDWCNGEEI